MPNQENNNSEIIEETQKNNNMTNHRMKKIVKSIPLERLYGIHRDVKNYHDKWDKNEVVKYLDLEIIDNFYTGVQLFVRAGSVVSAGLYLTNYQQEAGFATVAGLIVDSLASSYKEKFYQPEERKKKRDELIKDTENLYNSYLELMEILKPIRTDNNSLGNLGQAINTLQKETKQVLKDDGKNNLKELTLLEDSPKGWNPKSLWLRLRISKRDGEPEWERWKDDWEARRSEHEKNKFLIEVLQSAVSEYRQGISNDEIEKRIESEMLKLSKEEVEKENNPISINLDEHYSEEKGTEQDNQEIIAQQLQHPKKD